MRRLLLFFAILLSIGFNSNAQQVSIGDTVEFTGDFKKEYWNEDIGGNRFKTEDGVKYLVINKVKSTSLFYQETTPVDKEGKPTSFETIVTVKKDPYESMAFTMYQSGQLLEQAGKIKNGAIGIQIIGLLAGTSIALLGDSNASLIAGYSIVGVVSLTGFVMNIVGNSTIKQAGELFKKEKLKL